MNLRSRNFILFCITFLSLRSWGQGDSASPAEIQNIKSKTKNKITAKAVVRKKKAKDSGQEAAVNIDGSAIYEAPNFDSPVIEYLDMSKKVRISRKIYPGVGGLGAFYKIRLRKSVYGFITDTDVKIEGKSRPAHDSKDEEKTAVDEPSDPTQLQPEMEETEPDEDIAGDSIYLNKYWGLSYYSFNFSEVLINLQKSSNTGLIGIKRTGPTSFMGGLPLDLNVIFTTQAPEFYSIISSSTTGYMIMGDALINLAIKDAKKYLIFYGFGPMVRYSKWTIHLKQKPTSPLVDSQEVTLGVAANAGLAFKLGRSFVVRTDGKYYYEKQKYFGFGAALEYRY